MTDLGSFGSWGSDAFAINTGGKIVAWRWPRNGFAEGIIWDNGRVVDLGGPRVVDGDQRPRLGSRLGIPLERGGASVLIARSSGAATHGRIGTLGGKTSYAHGINDAGLIVGWSERTRSRRVRRARVRLGRRGK